MPKVLIVEDDADLRRGYALRLESNGYAVVQAEDGAGAVSATTREHPDLVLLDLGLPGGDGLTVLARLAETPELVDIPVVVLTGRDPHTAEPAVQNFHVSAFLRKPVENDMLLHTIERALRGESTPPGYAAAMPSAWHG